jgi:hypothetical protein
MMDCETCAYTNLEEAKYCEGCGEELTTQIITSEKSVTAVVHIQRSSGVIVQDCDIYIGRAWNSGGWKLKASKWANPFTVKKYGLDLALEKYESYIRSNKELMADLPSLRGKVLGCWCKPNRCHGDILIKLLNEFD